MASVAGYAIGTAVAGPWGGMIGGMIGGYIDQAFLFPAIFGGQEVEVQGPRIDDWRVMKGSEGSPKYRVYGYSNRVPATVLWCGDIEEIEVVDEDTQGGKGSGAETTTTTTRYLYQVDMLLAIACNELVSVYKVWMDSKQFYRGSGSGSPVTDKSRVSAVRFRPGDGSNAAVDEYEAAVSVAPRYHYDALLGLKNLKLADVGNRIPNITACPQESSGAQDTKTVIGKILEDVAGFEADEYDVSDLPADGAFRGVTIAGPQAPGKILEAIMIYRDYVAQESEGAYRFFVRDGNGQHTVTASGNHLAAHQLGSAVPPKLAYSDASTLKLPRRVTVHHIDPEQHWGRGSQIAVRDAESQHDTSFSIDLPITMPASHANKVAYRRLWRPFEDRQPVELSLPPSYFGVQEGDLLSIDSGDTVVRVREVSVGDNFLVKVSGVIKFTQEVECQEEGDDPNDWEDEEYEPTDTELLIMDLAPLRDEDIYTPGYYHAICASSDDDTWRSASLYRSDASDGDYAYLHGMSSEAQIGETVTALGACNSPRHWDDKNSVRIALSHDPGTLASCTREACLNGENRAYIETTDGHEIIGFTTVTDHGSGEYTLSGLLRGMRNTEEWTDDHAIGKSVAILSVGTVGLDVISTGLIGTTRFYKGPMSGGELDDYSAIEIEHEARCLRPFSPIHVRGSRDGSGNLTITWDRRYRGLSRIFAETGMPLEVDIGGYEIDVLNAAESVVRTIEVSGGSTLTASYTAAQQTTDFGSTVRGVHLRAYAVSDVIGRGSYVEARV